ncbi:cell surface glycoprotein CD200 receptor 1 isoform X1 [Sebastes umbrosus]|uniref:cell surface glycoprotein CD200 receptor 1 isoform X1 n=1 Tax=Sebastes umbrosus TaxID=72105 RepID=UPI0018A037C7|nr:cell surface glycoprotein CD200 receptor 1 isoform X1 [Sebastes umbrosus]
MNMASIGILLILTVYIYVSTGNAEAAFINVECKDEKVGQYGQQTLLECVVKTLQNDVEIRVVTWKKKDQKDQRPLLLFNRGLPEPKPGYSFAEPSWNVRNMNVSLLITNTAVEHQGDYTCMVITDSGDGSSSISLKVTAKYNKPTLRSNPEKITPNADVTLTCESKGGYPKGELRWFDEHNKTKNSQTEAKQTENGLFNLSSNLTLEHGSMGSKYTCRVFNASGGKEDEEVVVLPSLQRGVLDGRKEVDSATKIAAPAFVIGSLIVGLLIVMLWYYRRRSQLARRLSTAPLMGNHRGVPTYEPDVEEGDLQEKGDNHA